MTFTVAPEITVSDQLHGVGLGANVTIKCKVEAHPSAINYWMKDQVCNFEGFTGWGTKIDPLLQCPILFTNCQPIENN